MGPARVGYLAQRVFETGALVGIEGAAGGGADGEGRSLAGGQFGGAELFFRVGGQRFEPEPFGVVVKGEEVAAVALKADGFANRFPPGGLVTGAGVGLGVGEGFGQQRRVAAVGEPLVG